MCDAKFRVGSWKEERRNQPAHSSQAVTKREAPPGLIQKGASSATEEIPNPYIHFEA